MRLAASVLCDDWGAVETDGHRPVLGMPTGPYLSQATEIGREQVDGQVEALERAGYEVRRVRLFDDVDALNERHNRLVAAEAALAHAEWLDEYGDRYAPETVELVRDGQSVTVEELAAARVSRIDLREGIEDAMADRESTCRSVWPHPDRHPRESTTPATR